jgi:hypothetical protein
MSARLLPGHRMVLATLLAVTSSCVTSRIASARPSLASGAGPYEMEVLVDGGPAPTFTQGGETYLLGQVGARYTLRVFNRSPRRVEAVVSVDGRDVIDGRPADYRSKRGYLIPAWGSVDIEGWRTSHAEVAAFRFSSVARSYAARTGSAREVGVIGVALFPEQYIPPPPPPPQIVRPPYSPWRGYDRDEESGPPRSSEGRATPSPAPGARAPMPSDGMAENRPGLGTEFGEALPSYVQEMPFARANPLRPSVMLGLRYNDRPGLIAMGVNLDETPWYSEGDLRQTAEPFPVTHRTYAAPPPGWR